MAGVINRLHSNTPEWDKDISSGCHANPCSVVETHHADETSLVAFGGNCATVLTTIFGYRHNDENFQVELLKAAAAKLGYKLIKKSVKENHRG